MNSGGSAFPVCEEERYGSEGQYSNGIQCADSGITKRDYFAGQVLSGNLNEIINSIRKETFSFPEFAEFAYKIADALLAERDKG